MVDILREVACHENALRVPGQLVENVGHVADEVVLDPLRLGEAQDAAAVQIGGADEEGLVAADVGEEHQSVVSLPEEGHETFVLALENHTRGAGSTIEDAKGQASLVGE